jgi:ABC-type glycerol-3-phosphate transport system substrate-binding protein
MLRNILLGVGVFAALLAVLIFSGKIPVGDNNEKAQGEVVLWGTLPESGMSRVLQEFNPKAKSYRVVYREVRADQFNQTLLEALASGTGPDLILAPHQILLSQADRLYPFPITSFSEKAFKDTYVDGASIFFTPAGPIALPVAVDPLVLFYNRTLFSKHGIINPPQYWDEVLNMTPSLTLRNDKGGFDESSIALGAPNTSYSKDILMATVAELGQVAVLRQNREDGAAYFTVTANDPTATRGEVYPLATAARFFTQFADPTKNSYTWNQFAGEADDQFVAEKLAMYIGYAGELQTLRSRNPKADIEMTFFPQTKGYNTFTTGGQLYGIATLKASRNIITSLTVQSQFAGTGVSPSIAISIGAVPALRAYAGTPGLSDVVARSMLVAKPWYDKFPAQSASLVSSMLADIVSGRLGPSDAAGLFVSRLQELYNPI